MVNVLLPAKAIYYFYLSFKLLSGRGWALLQEAPGSNPTQGGLCM